MRAAIRRRDSQTAHRLRLRQSVAKKLMHGASSFCIQTQQHLPRN
jgi:hypothetical protein